MERNASYSVPARLMLRRQYVGKKKRQAQCAVSAVLSTGSVLVLPSRLPGGRALGGAYLLARVLPALPPAAVVSVKPALALGAVAAVTARIFASASLCFERRGRSCAPVSIARSLGLAVLDQARSTAPRGTVELVAYASVHCLRPMSSLVKHIVYWALRWSCVSDASR